MIGLLFQHRTSGRATSRDFARDLENAKQAATKGPVLITTRGKPEFALLTYHGFEALSRDKQPAPTL